MSIEIKKSIKPVNYLEALKILEERVAEINKSDRIRSLKNFENSKQTSINNKSKGMVVSEA